MPLERWLFARVDATSLAVFRLALVAVLTVGVFVWPMTDWWAAYGAVLHLGTATLVRSHRALAIAVLAVAAVGWRPRLAGVLGVAVLLPFALERRSMQLLVVALAATSLLGDDARSAWRRGGTAPATGPMWPIRLLQIELSTVYLVNALAKTTPDYLSGGVLAAFAVTLPNFVAQVRDGWLYAGGIGLPLAIAATASALAEWVLAVGFWVPRLRRAVAVFGVLFHLVLKLVIQIGMLDWTCMTLYLAFLLPFERDRSSAAAR